MARRRYVVQENQARTNWGRTNQARTNWGQRYSAPVRDWMLPCLATRQYGVQLFSQPCVARVHVVQLYGAQLSGAQLFVTWQGPQVVQLCSGPRQWLTVNRRLAMSYSTPEFRHRFQQKRLHQMSVDGLCFAKHRLPDGSPRP